MSTLKAEPAGRVRSMSEFFALARAMEADAAARYTETARQLRQRGETALAEVFDRLAVTERGHVQQVTAWAANQDEASSAVNQLPWPLPDTFDAPPEEIASSKLVTPYRALASAVRHEERSFAFWAYVSAHADKPEVKEAAERMALEELEHVTILRRERRKAFHAERQGAASAQGPIALASLASIERRLATLIEQNPQCAAGGSEFAVSLAAAARDDGVKARHSRCCPQPSTAPGANFACRISTRMSPRLPNIWPRPTCASRRKHGRKATSPLPTSWQRPPSTVSEPSNPSLIESRTPRASAESITTLLQRNDGVPRPSRVIPKTNETEVAHALSQHYVPPSQNGSVDC